MEGVKENGSGMREYLRNFMLDPEGSAAECRPPCHHEKEGKDRMEGYPGPWTFRFQTE